MQRPRSAVILAAGQGTRMKSSLSKVLHPVAGKPMLDWSIDLARSVGAQKIVVVVGAHNPDAAALVEQRLGPGASVLQDPPLGTGHAVLAAREALAGFEGDVVVLYADTPLVEQATIERLFGVLAKGAAVGVLGFVPPEPGAYGRLIENEQGGLERIVEAREASPQELAVTLCNSGVLCADRATLFDLLSKVTNDNAKGEYYLTDVVGLARARGLTCAVARADAAEVGGANDRIELAGLEAVFQERKRAALMREGVTLIAPQTVFFAHDTQIARDVTIEPNVVFGPGVVVHTGAVIRAFSHLEQAIVRERAIIGPYARLRPKADIGEGAHIGNFVEVKNVRVGPGAKANHLSYLGDGTIGEAANIGAGTIFCNYDGFDKHETHIGAWAFVGSNSSLVAPVRIGNGAYTGSGSVITKDVPDNALALERSEAQVREGWADRFREMKRVKRARKT